MIKTFIMLALVCLAALVMELDFFIALPKFGAEHFGAPDDLKELVKKIPDLSKVRTACGLIVMIASFIAIIAAAVWAFLDSCRNYSGIFPVFLRFLIILEGYKIFDIVCFDWFLLTRIRFPEKLWPQTKGAKGYDSFGFNAKSQITKMVVFVFLALAIAVIISLISR